MTMTGITTIILAKNICIRQYYNRKAPCFWEPFCVIELRASYSIITYSQYLRC